MPGPSTKDTVHSLVQDINRLSHKLIAEDTDQLTPSQAIVEAVQSAKASLMTAIASVTGASPLPHKENIAPNQHSWTETAQSMGVKKGVKCCRLPEEVGLTEKTIGAVKGKCHQVYTDPYTGGKRPGKLAKPDALSNAANPKARTCAPPLASQSTPARVPPPLAVPLLSASQPIPGSAFLPLALPAQTVHHRAFPFAPTFAFAPSQPIPAHMAPPFAAPLLPASQPTPGPAFWALPLALGPATQTPRDYMFPPTLPSAFPPTTAL
ncbi:hypothetical protein EDB85DRAFT_2159509 [Lactarius pseudohatsudake]|nr:hypothetical protein EDB85DRAFT_2159509 [Lactarius pseudohatsudake]